MEVNVPVSKINTTTSGIARLLPISAAATQHSLRTYLQVKTWLENNLLPTGVGNKKMEI
jgi:hypothetical protein